MLGPDNRPKENNTLPLVNCGPIIEGGMNGKKNILEDKLSRDIILFL